MAQTLPFGQTRVGKFLARGRYTERPAGRQKLPFAGSRPLFRPTLGGRLLKRIQNIFLSLIPAQETATLFHDGFRPQTRDSS